MAKTSASTSLFSELFSASLYKRSQGQRVRQITAAVIAVVFVVGAWSVSTGVLGGYGPYVQAGIPVLVGLFGAWFGFRVVNHVPAAEFLIGVQGEMDKVSWPAWPQLWRATIVVLVVMVFLSIALFVFDVIWRYVFSAVGFLQV